jgi:hypothetical protein
MAHRFPDFERWWKDRMGLVEADTPVLPEYFAHKLSQMGLGPVAAEIPKAADASLAVDTVPGRCAVQSGRQLTALQRCWCIESWVFHCRTSQQSGTRRPVELWKYLTPRLRVMAAMRKEWGDVSAHYISRNSVCPKVADRLLVSIAARCLWSRGEHVW